MTLMDYIVGKNSIITSNVGGGSTSFTLYLVNNLSEEHAILYYSTGSIDRYFIKNYYPSVYNNCTFFIATLELFLDYITGMGSKLENFSYIVIDTADVVGKDTIIYLIALLDIYNIKLIVTSQLRVNPNNSKPYSTVEEWNKQISSPIFDNSIWLRNVTEPNNINKRKYIDIYPYFRRGNNFDKRYILSFDKRRGNVL